MNIFIKTIIKKIWKFIFRIWRFLNKKAEGLNRRIDKPKRILPKTVFIDKTYKNIISSQGFLYSGSSTLIGLFQEFNNTTTLGMPDYVYSGKKVKKGAEVRFFADSNVFNFIEAFYSDNEVYQDAVIKKFIHFINVAYYNKGLYSWDKNPLVYNEFFLKNALDFLFATLELDDKSKILAEKNHLPLTWDSADEKYKGYSFMFGEGIHQYIFYKYKKIEPKVFEFHVKNFFSNFFNSVQSKDYLICDQLLNTVKLDKLAKINQYLDTPIKTISVIRDPRDQYISAFRHNDTFYLSDTLDGYVNFYLSMVQPVINSNNPHRLVLRFEDIVLKYDESVQKIIDFVGIDKSCHIAPKSVFNPALSVVNIGGYKKFHNQDFMKQIEERLPNFCYYPEKENLSEEAWKMLKENNFKELE